MDNSQLLENAELCYLPLFKLQEWLKENKLLNKDFAEAKEQWKDLPSFFIDTELLVSEKDIILLQVKDENVAEYLAKTYQIKEQKFCQKLFRENKHLILLTRKQWELLNNNQLEEKREENCVVLFKDEEIIKGKLTEWLKKLSQIDEKLPSE